MSKNGKYNKSWQKEEKESVSPENFIANVTLDSTNPSKHSIRVEGNNADKVKDVTLELMKPLLSNKMTSNRNPWNSGSFYLVAMVIIISLFFVVAKMVTPFVFPVVLITSLIGVSIIGALQLLQDTSLNEENFLKLMGLSFKQIPFIKRTKVKENVEDESEKT